jgi:hypothetical protein
MARTGGLRPGLPLQQDSTYVAASCVVTAPANSGTGSLRNCLDKAKNGTTITFSTSVFPPDNPATIYLSSPLPMLTSGGVTIDASNAGVILDSGQTVNIGLNVASSNNTIMGLLVLNFYEAGLSLRMNAQYNQIGGDPTVGAGPFSQGNVFGGDD